MEGGLREISSRSSKGRGSREPMASTPTTNFTRYTSCAKSLQLILSPDLVRIWASAGTDLGAQFGTRPNSRTGQAQTRRPRAWGDGGACSLASTAASPALDPRP
eukprot:3401042-Rhodomonas_salina.1